MVWAFSNKYKEIPTLLILDNHESHISIDFIDLASQNGVVVLIILPHTTHELQPLEMNVYWPFKCHYNKEFSSSLVSHPSKSISIYDLAEISGRVWAIAFMPSNIISNGFAVKWRSSRMKILVWLKSLIDQILNLSNKVKFIYTYIDTLVIIC